jgi:hypothetical protein
MWSGFRQWGLAPTGSGSARRKKSASLYRDRLQLNPPTKFALFYPLGVFHRSALFAFFLSNFPSPSLFLSHNPPHVVDALLLVFNLYLQLHSRGSEQRRVPCDWGVGLENSCPCRCRAARRRFSGSMEVYYVCAVWLSVVCVCKCAFSNLSLLLLL